MYYSVELGTQKDGWIGQDANRGRGKKGLKFFPDMPVLLRFQENSLMTFYFINPNKRENISRLRNLLQYVTDDNYNLSLSDSRQKAYSPVD